MKCYSIINVEKNIDQNLSFYLRENLDTEQALINGIANLSNIKTKSGTSFDSLTYLAVNYFYDNVYVFHKKDDNDSQKKYRYKKPEKITLANIKAILDACNYTSYTPIETINNTEYKELFLATYYEECYLIIQTAYFFGSKRFGEHPYFEAVDHYEKTGTLLQNGVDIERLKSTFKKIDAFREWKKDPTKLKKKPSQYNRDIDLNNWYYGVLDVLANIFGTCKNYKYEYPLKEDGVVSEYRLYNKFIQTRRILRKVQPFEMIEFDIKSGHLSYIDLLVGSRVSKTAYENYAKKHGVSRDEAKRRFQSILNLRDFRNTWKKREEYITILCGFGWTVEQAKRIVSEITDSPSYLFGHWASKYESEFVKYFAEINNIVGWTRGHDSLTCLKRRDVDYTKFCTSFENGIIQFELEEIGLYQCNFTILQHKGKRRKAIYFSGLQMKSVIKKKVLCAIPPIVLRFKDNVVVTWKKDDPEKKQSFIVPVNLNYHESRFEYYSPKIDGTKDIIRDEIVNAYKTFLVLNNYNISRGFAYSFCQHIRKYLLFDVIAYSRLLINECGSDFVPKIRNTQCSVNYDNSNYDDYNYVEIIDDDNCHENNDSKEFNNMVGMNIASGICSREYEILKIKKLIKNWIVGAAVVPTKPKKYTGTKELLTKMYEIDNIGRRGEIKINCITEEEILKKNTFSENKSICIITESIIRGDLFRKMAFFPQIDRKRTKIRQQAQLKRQEQNWHKADEKRTLQIMLAKEIAPQIDNWINYKSKYNIEYVDKFN